MSIRRIECEYDPKYDITFELITNGQRMEKITGLVVSGLFEDSGYLVVDGNGLVDAHYGVVMDCQKHGGRLQLERVDEPGRPVFEVY